MLFILVITFLVDLYTSLLMQIFNQPIMWQQIIAYKHADMVKRLAVFIQNFRIGKKCDFSHFDHGRMPDMVVWVSQQSLEFAENGVKNKKTSSEQQFCGQKRLVNESGQRIRARLVKGRKVEDSNVNNHTLQQWYAEEYLWTHNALNL